MGMVKELLEPRILGIFTPTLEGCAGTTTPSTFGLKPPSVTPLGPRGDTWGSVAFNSRADFDLKQLACSVSE